MKPTKNDSTNTALWPDMTWKDVSVSSILSCFKNFCGVY